MGCNPNYDIESKLCDGIQIMRWNPNYEMESKIMRWNLNYAMESKLCDGIQTMQNTYRYAILADNNPRVVLLCSCVPVPRVAANLVYPLTLGWLSVEYALE